MRTLLKTLLVLALLSGLGVAIYLPAASYIKQAYKTKYRFEEVTQGDLTLHVNASGTVEPVLRVTVGAVVSGPILELHVDFNDHVEKDQLMARIDPRIYESLELRDQAMMLTRLAEVKRAEARLQQTSNAEERAGRLSTAGSQILSDTELDELRFAKLVAEADLSVAKAAVEQAQANLDNSQANLAYTEIRSPVDGIVIDRKIDAGQTLAAQFQTPELFVVAPEMDQKMHIYASVDEADIGLIRTAQEQKQPVKFTVDAYPDLVFEEGQILEVRLSSSEQQNVVTYPVLVETPNADLKLLPGMTANLSFQIEHLSDVVRIPNSALRFYPPKRELVHVDDRPVLDGLELANNDSGRQNINNQSASERADLNRRRQNRHVWILEGDFLRARAVQVGISDSRYTELVSGELQVGEQLVVGEQPKT
jgi:HlyD family secretion protein